MQYKYTYKPLTPEMTEKIQEMGFKCIIKKENFVIEQETGLDEFYHDNGKEQTNTSKIVIKTRLWLENFSENYKDKEGKEKTLKIKTVDLVAIEDWVYGATDAIRMETLIKLLKNKTKVAINLTEPIEIQILQNNKILVQSQFKLAVDVLMSCGTLGLTSIPTYLAKEEWEIINKWLQWQFPTKGLVIASHNKRTIEEVALEGMIQSGWKVSEYTRNPNSGNDIAILSLQINQPK